MRFKRLRLAGFKSFVDPTELRIEDGLTGVVGPNGCGKSNLLEAIRWVMGESSPKSLRGGGMEDVIFAGTQSRPSRDFADVTLQLDNDDRTAPAQFNDGDQIEVTRRIERGLGSAYRINGKDVRQKDVQLLFADAATGAHSPALVSQGRIGAIIAAKPQERRAMLEEAAGIAGLHVRRKDAEQRLRAAEANLSRLDDVLQTMEAQANALRRQAKQAERYRLLSDRIRRIEGQTLFARWREAAQAAEDAKRASTVIEGKVTEATRDAARLSAAQAEAAAGLPGLRQAEAEAAAGLQALNQARQSLIAKLQQVERRQQELAASRNATARDLDREAGLAEDAGAALERLAAEAAALDTRIGEAREGLEIAAQRVAAAETAATQDERELNAHIEAQAEAQALHRAAESALAAAAARLRRAHDEVARLERERDALRADDGEEGAREEAEADFAEAEATIGSATARIEAADAARIEAETARDDATRLLAEARAAAAALSTERDALARMLATPASGGGKSALDSIRVNSGYEAALAAALGDDLSAGIGAATTGRTWAGAEAGKGDPALPASVTPLAAQVDAPPELARRLAQVGVADTDAAPALVSKLAVGQRLVSRDGRLWRWDGFVAHGGQSAAAAERLVQRNRLAEIEAQLPPAQARVGESQNKLDDARARFDAAQADERAGREARTQAERRREAARSRLAQLAAALERRNSRLESLEHGLARASEELAAAEAGVAEGEANRDKLPDVTALGAVTAEARRAVDTSRATLASARADHAGLSRGLEGDVARLGSVGSERAGWERRLAGSATQRAELDARQGAIAEELAGLAERPAQIAERQARLADDIHAAEAGRRAAADALAAAETGLRGVEAELRTASERQAQAREERARLATLAEQHELRRIEVARLAGERFQCPPPLLPGQLGFDEEDVPAAEALTVEMERLTLDRERIGPVNLRAETELAELDETRTSSESERAELETAIARLRGSIGSLNREGRVRLLAAFEAVNTHFRELFTTLFNGGAAHLELIESDDPLEAGLEIMAQPPGKKLQSLTLLSGGEQALTAVALIFGVFLTNPAPICVLDEVDAPLDDANVERFCDLLDRMTELTDTRFLIVTHNAVTMSRMHRLFGVTMAERGVSQLVSVDLERAGMLLAAE
ncbi:chromosome segregation protein SMC [Sphingoaurantiacus capsulatus]|uniref:Chromosome partition protein Smc n=1 Tax=Sphingoaurantiacus capsulatus TaxID=1771310 RepID=A0ABV7XE13_9SPHN